MTRDLYRLKMITRLTEVCLFTTKKHLNIFIQLFNVKGLLNMLSFLLLLPIAIKQVNIFERNFVQPRKFVSGYQKSA